MANGRTHLNILVDMDDTLEELLVAWVAWLNKTYQTTVNAHDITDWRVSKFFPMLTEEEVFAPLSIEAFWKTVTPEPQAQYYLNKLIEDGTMYML